MSDLREEARQSWNYYFTDEVVYVEKPLHVDVNSIRLSAEAQDWINAESWIEAKIRFFDQRQNDYHFMAIIEAAGPNYFSGLKEPDIVGDSCKRNPMMLINDCQFVEPPERTVSIGIPCVVRLKFLNDPPSIVRHSFCMPGKCVRSLRGKFSDDRELRVGINLCVANDAQIPRDVIQCGTKAVKEISDKYEDPFRRIGKGDIQPELPFFRVVFFGENWGVQFVEGFNFGPCSFEMFMRPFGFEFRMGDASVLDASNQFVVTSSGRRHK